MYTVTARVEVKDGSNLGYCDYQWKCWFKWIARRLIDKFLEEKNYTGILAAEILDGSGVPVWKWADGKPVARKVDKKWKTHYEEM